MPSCRLLPLHWHSQSALINFVHNSHCCYGTDCTHSCKYMHWNLSGNGCYNVVPKCAQNTCLHIITLFFSISKKHKGVVRVTQCYVFQLIFQKKKSIWISWLSLCINWNLYLKNNVYCIIGSLHSKCLWVQYGSSEKRL